MMLRPDGRASARPDGRASARKSFVLLVVGMVVFFLCSVASADVPDSINYQGKLTTASGGCLNDTVQMTFTIYADAFGTVPEWSETQTQVEVKEGIFNVLLGSISPLAASIFDGSAKYLGVRVESDPEMSPLKPMVTTTYAFGSHHAQEADTADYARAAPAAGIASVDGVSNPGGDVDLIQQDAITVSPNDGANTITFGETHSGRTDNPHAVTAAQTGAPVAVDGVSNAGGDIDFIAGSNMTITPNDGANTITFSTTATVIPHGVIVMWSGSPTNVPDGWALCDGDEGTPDLTDRFILPCTGGAGCPGAIGGTTSHNHSVDIAGFKTSGDGGSWFAASGGVSRLNHYNHNHTVNPPLTYTTTISHLPPYYKLAFIMKL